MLLRVSYHSFSIWVHLTIRFWARGQVDVQRLFLRWICYKNLDVNFRLRRSWKFYCVKDCGFWSPEIKIRTRQSSFLLYSIRNYSFSLLYSGLPFFNNFVILKDSYPVNSYFWRKKDIKWFILSVQDSSYSRNTIYLISIESKTVHKQFDTEFLLSSNICSFERFAMCKAFVHVGHHFVAVLIRLHNFTNWNCIRVFIDNWFSKICPRDSL